MSEFTDALEIIQKHIPQTIGREYDGIIVKKLESTNTLDEGKSGHQTHIAITGAQMDIFPYVSSPGYFNKNYDEKDDTLKNYFILQVPFYLNRDNIVSLEGDSDNDFSYNADGYCKALVSIVRSRRKEQADQIQISKLALDDPSFIAFRKLVHSQDYLVVLKHRKKPEYDCFGVRAATDIGSALATMNGKFFKENTSSLVKVAESIYLKDEEPDGSDYSLDELGSILKQMYSSVAESYKQSAIQAFCIKFGKTILKKGFATDDIARVAGLSDFLTNDLKRGINLYLSLRDGMFDISILDHDRNYLDQVDGIRKTGAENILVYGVPGSGKSHYIQHNYCADRKYIERVVFHPDYTYSDFVGQILPRVINGQLKYVFAPGPFTKIMQKAYWDPENYYYLIIEELNRGNAPAIFGEVFQLLDRKNGDMYPASEVGESEYGITNYDIAREVYRNEHSEVKIPSNLFVLATMNTSDQNVFTLDTAFQRRWIMRLVKNDVEAAQHSNVFIEDTNITWGGFASVINKHILEVNEGLGSSEDKRLGAYFAKERELARNRFPGKVLKYLWDDAFKFGHDSVFSSGIDSFEALIEIYENTNSDRLQSVLRAEVYDEMVSAVANKSVSTEEE